MGLTKEARLKGMATQLRNMGMGEIADQIEGSSPVSDTGSGISADAKAKKVLTEMQVAAEGF